MQDIHKKIYQILMTVFHDPQYAPIAKRYYRMQDAFICSDEPFTEGQMQVINDYIDMLLKIHETMMKIAVSENL